MAYEYKVVAAPKAAPKAKGVKGTDARFAAALSTAINREAGDGWEYQRADALPCEYRVGVFRKARVAVQYVLVFRRELPKPVALPDGPTPEEMAQDLPQAEGARAEPTFTHEPAAGSGGGSQTEPRIGPARKHKNPTLRPLPGADR